MASSRIPRLIAWEARVWRSWWVDMAEPGNSGDTADDAAAPVAV